MVVVRRLIVFVLSISVLELGVGVVWLIVCRVIERGLSRVVVLKEIFLGSLEREGLVI